MDQSNHDIQTILLLRTSDACYYILNLFIDELAKALRSCQQPVEILDMTKENPPLEHFLSRRFKAVIGIQTNLISSFSGQKYLILLDHPITIYDNFKYDLKDCYVLTHDRNYLSFMQHYYKNLAGCFYFPPAGTFPSEDHFPKTCLLQKQYGITFMGTYRNYREPLSAVRSSPRPYRILSARLIHLMRQKPDCPAEKTLEEALSYYGLSLSDHGFLEMFIAMKPVFDCVMFYYREKIVRTLLNAGIEIHVYGDSWKNSPFSKHPRLLCHPAMVPADTLRIMQHSKLSLNIMSWHKDGLTERVLNAMLCQSAVLSDKSTRLEEEFIDGEDILLFDLSKLDLLPERILALLSDDAKLHQIAMNGYRKVVHKHLWIHRAKELLNIL
jgi:glycosyltransferase involved in cell wall biosynthesis